jgi:hypothetical protein
MSAEDTKKRKSLRPLFLWTALCAIPAIIAAVIFQNIQWLQTLASISALVLFGMPFLPRIGEFFEEINILGVSIKVSKALDTVQKRQLLNQVVTTVAAHGVSWFWIDESGNAHSLPDIETAQFLAKEKGIIRVEPNEVQLTANSKSFLSIKSAVPMQNANNKFILYNDTLYYQSSLGFLYRLAAWQKVDFAGKQIEQWGEPNNRWVKNLSPDDFTKYQVV